ncbi:MAG: phosphotransferase [Actinomycetota bacterium]|nr:phosphotransferase [Actinomycetota bacterium]
MNVRLLSDERHTAAGTTAPGSRAGTRPLAGVGVDNRSLRRADSRFLLPASAGTITVLPGAEPWAEAIGHWGSQVTVGGEPPDLVVAPAVAAAEAARLGAPMVVLEGTSGRRTLRAGGYRIRSWMALPSLEEPRVLVPVGSPDVARYAMRSWAACDRAWKRVRNFAAGTILGHGATAALYRTVTVGVRTQAPPFLMAAARDLGVPPDAPFLLNVGGGDILSRAAFQVFPNGSRFPAWVLKFSRVRGYDRPFVEDERGLGLIAGAGLTAAAHAPRLLGRFQVDGYNASLETAAVGVPLDHFLASPKPRRTKLAVVDEIAAWILTVAGLTSARSALLDVERRRLTEEVLPQWGCSPELVDAVADVPAVLQHNDLGCWNMVVGDGDFQVIDWEKARAHGFPLWDLFYFLTDALALVDGAGDAGWDRYVARLYRGELASSAILFGWTRRMVSTLGVPAHAVGPLAALCWMHHGMSHLSRREVGGRFQANVSLLPRAERVAPLWLADPALGTSWHAWRG